MNDSEFEKWVLPPLRGCWYLTGPTSSGKTPLALAVAQNLNAEIISMDSMAIYRGMNIGTAKPDEASRQQVPHHQLDIIDPTESYSVSNFVTSTHEIAAEIQSRGKNVLICGGTPLYLKSLIRGLFLGPEADWEFRDSVEADIANYGQGALRERLLQVDPLLAHKIHPHDHRRMIRALEVARTTGRPLSHWQQQFDSPSSPRECPVAVLRLERSWLHELIEQRVDWMIGAGLADEVAGLLKQHGELGRTAAQAVGYREMLEHLRGDTTIDEASERIKAHTRQFARRQEIWFRGLSELIGVCTSPEAQEVDLVDQVCDIFSSVKQSHSN